VVLEFRKGNRKSFFPALPVELEGDVQTVVSQTHGHGQLPLVRIDMGDGTGNGNDPIGQLGCGRRELELSFCIDGKGDFSVFGSLD
jgi:hypothetical protein